MSNPLLDKAACMMTAEELDSPDAERIAERRLGIHLTNKQLRHPAIRRALARQLLSARKVNHASGIRRDYDLLWFGSYISGARHTAETTQRELDLLAYEGG